MLAFSISNYAVFSTKSQSTLRLGAYDYPSQSNGNLIVLDSTVVNKMTYDAKGNQLTSTDSQDVTTEFEYDEKDRITSCDIDDGALDLAVNYSDGADDGGVTATVTDAEGNISIEVTDAEGNVTETQDVLTGGDDIVCEYSYDKLGRKVCDIFYDMSYVEYSYVGDTDRISSKRTVKSNGEIEDITGYVYDSRGRVASVTRSSGDDLSEYIKTEYEYDAENKVISETTTNHGKENVIRYAYDSEGRLEYKGYPSDTGIGLLSYEYDQWGRCTAVKEDDEVLREYIYYWFGEVSVIKDYDKPGSSSFTRTVFEYDPLFRQTAVKTYEDNSYTILESHVYEYDNLNQISKYTHVNNLTTDAVNETRDYTYDSHGNLSRSVKTDKTDSTAVTTSYVYDDVGNRISMTEGGVTTTYSYNSLDQLTQQTSNGATVKYSYDQKGNCIKESGNGKTVTMDYSVLGEMTEWSDGTLTQTNAYDHNGQRVKRTENSDTDYYFYDNGEVAVIEDSSSVTAANILNNEGGIIGSYRGSVYHNYLKDMQGSVTSIIKEDGTLSAAYDYTDFGETTELTGNGFDNQICYTGGIYDKKTGLYYLNARYYDPEIGRFISQDSYRGELNDPGQWHLYAYCANNPINYVDPSGQKRISRRTRYTYVTSYWHTKRFYKKSDVLTLADGYRRPNSVWTSILLSGIETYIVGPIPVAIFSVSAALYATDLYICNLIERRLRLAAEKMGKISKSSCVVSIKINQYKRVSPKRKSYLHVQTYSMKIYVQNKKGNRTYNF